MNILLLTHSYPDANQKWRGLFIKEQVNALSIEHDIVVVYFKADYSRFAPFSKYSFTREQVGRVTEYEVTVNKSFPVITQLKYLSETYNFINKEILNQTSIDVIHCHLSYPAGFLGVMIQVRKKIPCILTEHTWIKKYFRSWIHKKCVLYALKKATCVISVSKALKDDIFFYCNRKIEVVPNVIEVEKFKITGSKKDDFINLGILGGMGNLRKGLDILLKSLALLKRTDIKLHIGGDGKLLDSFKMLSKELEVNSNCIFYGEILPSDVPSFYSKLDIYVLASRDETFGVVVIEAMANGLPVIATKCGGPEEIITDNTGMLVEKENPQELADAIQFISENLAKYNKKAIHEYALQKYGKEAFVQNITRIYRNIISIEP